MWAIARGSLFAVVATAGCDSRGETTHESSQLDVGFDDDLDDGFEADDVGQIAEAASSPDRWVGPTHARAIVAETDDGVAACAAYCRAFGTTCGSSPFADLRSCTDRCRAWPTGERDEVGDTLACRTAMLTDSGSCIGASPQSPICRAPRVVRATGREPRAAAL